MTRSLKDRVFFWVLLLLPIISSVLSTIHVIALTSLANPIGMAIATAITFEIASLVSFLLSSGTILKNVSKGWIFFIFILLFILQAFGNIYAGFSNMTDKLALDASYLDTFMEMCFGIFNITEAKWVISAGIGLPLPLISLIMIKFALDSTDADEKPEIKEEQDEELTTNPYYEEENYMKMARPADKEKEEEIVEKNEEKKEPESIETDINAPKQYAKDVVEQIPSTKESHSKESESKIVNRIKSAVRFKKK